MHSSDTAAAHLLPACQHICTNLHQTSHQGNTDLTLWSTKPCNRMSAEVLHCLRSLGKAGCQQQRELVPRLQHPLVHQQLPGAPKAAFTRAAAQSCSTQSIPPCSFIKRRLLHQQYTKGRLKWKTGKQILAKTAQIPHKILKAMSDWIVELGRDDSDTFIGQLSAQPSARENSSIFN